MQARPQALPFDPATLPGLSERLLRSHHQNNYGGAVKRLNAIREQLGLNEPWWVQLGIFLKQIATFDWGRSWATNESVANLFATLRRALRPTLADTAAAW